MVREGAALKVAGRVGRAGARRPPTGPGAPPVGVGPAMKSDTARQARGGPRAPDAVARGDRTPSDGPQEGPAIPGGLSVAQKYLREPEIGAPLLMPIVVVEAALVTNTGHAEIPQYERAMP